MMIHAYDYDARLTPYYHAHDDAINHENANILDAHHVKYLSVKLS